MRKRKELEAHLESACVKWARDELGLLSRKLNGLGFNSWPDRMFIPARRRRIKYMKALPVWFVEFKREGKKPTEAQAEMHAELYERKQMVSVIDDFEYFKHRARLFANMADKL